MLKGIVALLTTSQAKVLGFAVGVSLLLESFSLQISKWATAAGLSGVRPEIISILVSLVSMALLAIAALSALIFIAKRVFRFGKGKRLGLQLYEEHLEQVQILAGSLEGPPTASDTHNAIKAPVVALIEKAVRTRNKAKRLCRNDEALSTAFAHYIESLKTVVDLFDGSQNQAGEGGDTTIEKSAPALHNLLFALGHFDKSRKTKRASRKLVSLTEKVSKSAAEWMKSAGTVREVTRPDVVNRAQHKISRRDRRKLSPTDEPGKIFKTDRE